jgi:hypothetical protein
MDGKWVFMGRRNLKMVFRFCYYRVLEIDGTNDEN